MPKHAVLGENRFYCLISMVIEKAAFRVGEKHICYSMKLLFRPGEYHICYSMKALLRPNEKRICYSMKLLLRPGEHHICYSMKMPFRYSDIVIINNILLQKGVYLLCMVIG